MHTYSNVLSGMYCYVLHTYNKNLKIKMVFMRNYKQKTSPGFEEKMYVQLQKMWLYQTLASHGLLKTLQYRNSCCRQRRIHGNTLYSSVLK